MKRKISIKKIAIAIILLVIIIAIIAIFLTNNKKDETILKEEITALSKKDITKDNYDITIKTTGDYAIIESTIKEYVKEYAENLQNILAILNDKELTSLLTADNYQNDGPTFTKSKEYLTTTKENFNNSLDKLSAMNTEEEIMQRIESQNLKDQYKNLYKELMLNGIKDSDFDKANEQLKEASQKINNILSVEEEVINLLSSNQDKWSVKDGKIIFKDATTLNSYNTITSKLSEN